MYIRKHETGNLAAGDLDKKQYYLLLENFGDWISWNKRWKAFTLKPKIKIIRKLHKMFPQAEWDKNIFLDMEGVLRENKEYEGVAKRIAKLKAMKKHDLDHLNYEFRIDPWEHQERGFRLIVNCPAMALLWDMRTGKTFVMVTAMEFLKQQGLVSKILVVCQKHIRINWVDDIQKFTDLRPLILDQMGGKAKVVALRHSNKITIVDGPNVIKQSGEPEIIITNHDSLRNKALRNELMSYGFDSLIVDESQCFRAGTMVDIAIGQRPIETIEPGDMVKNALGYRRVSHTFKRLAYELFEIKLTNGRTIICTPDHRFLTICGWRKASCIMEGEHLVKTDYAQEVLYEDLRVVRGQTEPNEDQILQYELLTRFGKRCKPPSKPKDTGQRYAAGTAMALRRQSG